MTYAALAMCSQALRCLVSILKSLAAWHSSQTEAAVVAADGGEAAAQPGTATVTVADEAAVPDESALQSGWMAKMAESGLAVSASEGVLGAAADGGAAGGDQRQAAMLESWKG